MKNTNQGSQVGFTAPDFTLAVAPGKNWTLSETHGRPRVVVFYPADFSPVCGDQLAIYNELLEEFKRFNAVLVGISVDSVWCHKAYIQQRKLEFPLLADFEPKGAVARRFGVYRHEDGICERAIFVLDAAGVIRWRYVSPIEINPGADGILHALESMAEQKAPA
jgi:peroxiredoxin